jgi:hypothetical protein
MTEDQESIMRKLALLSILLSGFICIAVIISPSRTKLNYATEMDQYDVYSAAIKHIYIGEGVKLELIEDVTSLYDVNKEDISNGLSYKLDSELINSLIEENGEPVSLRALFNLPVNYELVSSQQIQEILAEGEGREPFFKRYPGSPGVISLSRAGFNKRMDKAILYISRVCPGLCGEGSVVLLKREGEDWIVEERIRLWVS